MTVEFAPAPHLMARAAAATVLVMSGATTAHTWAGGSLPQLPGLLALAGVVFGAGLLFLRGVVRLSLLLPVVVVAQSGLHGMFGLLGASHGGHAHGATAMAPSTQMQTAPHWSWQMLVAHAVGTLLTVAVWWLAQRAAATVVGLLRTWTAYGAVRREVRPADRFRTVRHTLACLVVAPRRGPPALPLLA